MIAVLIALTAGISASTPIQVEGDGYLRFVRNDETVYAKQAEIGWSDGRLVAADGSPLAPLVKIEREPKSLQIDLQGRITAVYPDSAIQVGRLVLATFPDDVRPVVSGSFLRVYADATLADPGDGLAGVIRPWNPGSTNAPVRIPTEPVKPEPPQVRTESVVQPQRTVSNHKPDSAFIAGGGIEIVFPDTSEVIGESMTLADVADIYAAPDIQAKVQQIPLGNSPVFGVPRTLDRTNIVAKLRGAGFDVAKVRISGPVKIRIKRVGQTITQEMFAQCATESIQAEYPNFVSESQRPVPNLEAPMGELQLVADRPVRSGSNLSVTVVAYVDGKRINARTLLFSNQSAPVQLKVGDTVSVVVQSRDVRVESAATIKSVDMLTGRVTVTLPTGKQLTGRIDEKGKVVVSI